MAVNLINVSGIEGKTGTQLLTTSTAAVSGLGVADSATTTIIKLHTLVATNIDGSNDVDVSV